MRDDHSAIDVHHDVILQWRVSVTYKSTRRDFLKSMGVGLAGVIAADKLVAGLRFLPGSESSIFYVGTYTSGGSGGIYRCRLSLSSGSLTIESIVGGVTNPSFLAIDKARGRLFAVNETAEFEGKPGGSVSAFRLNPESGDLQLLNSRSTHGADPCHVTVDATGRFILVANYSGGSIAVLPVQSDGSLGEATDFVEHKGASVKPRQQGPHAHSINLNHANAFAYVADLGLDKVMI
jgi:6-phosphogluconolactonase